MEGMSSEQPATVEEQPTIVETESILQEEPTVVPREESEGEAGQADPVTPHLVGAKTRPMTRFATKQGPSKEAPASSNGQRRLQERGPAPKGHGSSGRVRK